MFIMLAMERRESGSLMAVAFEEEGNFCIATASAEGEGREILICMRSLNYQYFSVTLLLCLVFRIN
jgi:hypothetical protein